MLHKQGAQLQLVRTQRPWDQRPVHVELWCMLDLSSHGLPSDAQWDLDKLVRGLLHGEGMFKMLREFEQKCVEKQNQWG